MPEILKGLKGEAWEQALIITRPRARGAVRVIDDPANLMLILTHRTDAAFTTVDKIREFLKAEYNLDASSRNVKSAMYLLRDETNAILIKRICEQHSISPFPDETDILTLLKTELFWMPSVSVKIVGEALTRLGYLRDGSKWTRRV